MRLIFKTTSYGHTRKRLKSTSVNCVDEPKISQQDITLVLMVQFHKGFVEVVLLFASFLSFESNYVIAYVNHGNF